MYEAPKLVRYGQFRELTQQQGNWLCPGTQKLQTGLDFITGHGVQVTDDGCPARS